MDLRGRPLLLADGTIQPQVSGYETVQATEILASRFPRSLAERFDRALLNLARLSKHFGQLVQPTGGHGRSLVFAENDDEVYFTIRALEARGYTSGDLHSGGFTLQLTPEGWGRVEELRAGRAGEQFTQAFVATWFGNDKDRIGDRSSAEFCTGAFLAGFKPGINNAGYSERRIDFKEFNDDVMDEIITEIRRSKFVVADFTGHRAGVYYEAGFAKGLGLTVIFTCRKDHVESAHFDTSHMNHLTWSSFGELAEKLERRIVATIGQGPLAAQRVGEPT
jgi:nucleoside 2-deoxyribosyltransferase